MSVDLQWNDKWLLKNVAKITDIKTKAGAEMVLKEAQRLVSKGETKKLVGEIKVRRGKFNEGDWVVEAQGKGNYTKYYAIFVELGHYSSVYGKYKRPTTGGSLKGISPVKIPKKPYLRPSLNKDKRKLLRSFSNALDKMGVKENW